MSPRSRLLALAILLVAGSDPSLAPAQTPTAWPEYANLTAPVELEIALPEPTGPHQVGTVTYHWVDPDREESATDDPGDLRQVVAQIWYPAAPSPGRARTPYMPQLQAMRGALRTRSDSFPRQLALDLAVHAGVRGHALSGPALVESGPTPRHPVAVLSPGGNVSRHWYTALMEELASHGYVAVAVSHPYVGWDVFPAGGFLKSIDWGLDADDPARARAADDRLADLLAGDVALLLQRLVELDAADPDGRFTDRLDLDRLAILGHSRGGSTVARTCTTDPRLDACVILDNIGPDREMETGIPRPQMTVRRGDWDEGRVERLRGFLGRNAVEAWDVAIDGATHFDFTDLPIVDPTRFESGIGARRAHRIVSGLVLVFLDRHVRECADRSVERMAGRWEEVTAVRLVP